MSFDWALAYFAMGVEFTVLVMFAAMWASDRRYKHHK